MAPVTETKTPITYGNLRSPARPGVLGLGMAASLMLFAAAVVVMLMLMFFGLLPALIALVVMLGAVAPMIVGGKEGRTGYGRLGSSTVFRPAKRAKKTMLVGGVTGQAPDGQCRLPGILAPTVLRSAEDVYKTPVGVLIIPAADHYTVILQTDATGNELVDAEQVDAQVREWGGWIAHQAHDQALAAFAVCVETAPDPGTRLRRMLNSHAQPDAPPFATATLDEIKESYPVASSSITTRIAITWSGKARMGEPKRSEDDMIAYIARSLPGLIHGLQLTGAGTAARPMSAQDITDAIRVAYDPAVAELVETMRGEGGTGLRWEDAGPVYQEDRPRELAHDGAISRVWTMRTPPEGTFYDNVLKDVLVPHPDIARKRVTIVYRPISVDKATRQVERDVNDAITKATSRSRPRVRDRDALGAAEKAAAEEAQGAGLTRFGIIITATVTDPKAVLRLDSLMSLLTARSRIRLRVAYNNQSASFAAGLPLGLVLPEHLALPEWLRDTL